MLGACEPARVPTPIADAEPEDARLAIVDAEAPIVDARPTIPDARLAIVDAQPTIPDARLTILDARANIVDAQATVADSGVVIADIPDAGAACADDLTVEYVSVRDPAMGQVMTMRIRAAGWIQELTRDGGPMTCTTKVRGSILDWQCSTDMGLAFGEVDAQSAFVVFRDGFMTFGSPTRPPAKESARKPWSCPSPHFHPKGYSSAPH